MKLKEFLLIVNYSDFSICIDSDKGLKTIFKTNIDRPLEYISDNLLNREIKQVYINNKSKKELFLIEVQKEGGNNDKR